MQSKEVTFNIETQRTPLLEQVPPMLLKTVLRLLGEKVEQSQEKQKKESYCWLYLNPFTKRSFFFSILYLILFYIIQFQLSLEVAFGSNFIEQEIFNSNATRLVYFFFLAFLLFDMALSFQKGYYAYGQGRVIQQASAIRRNYLKKQFWFDITVIIFYCVPLFSHQYAINFLQLVPAVLMWTKKAQHQREMSAYLDGMLRNVFAIILLCIDVLMMGNYGACLFVGMDLLLLRIQFFGSNSAFYWLSNNSSYPYNLVGGLWYVQYVYAQSFSTGTLSTLAPGPFAKNWIEVLYAIFVMIFFMLLASYVGEVIVSILYSESRLRIFHEENVQSLDAFMQLKGVAASIKTKIFNFFQLIWEAEVKMQSDDQDQILTILPTALRQQLLIQIGFTKALPFLNNLPKSKQIIRMTSLALVRMTLDSNSSLNEASEPTIFYIKEGMGKYYFKYLIQKETDYSFPKDTRQIEMGSLSSPHKPFRSSTVIALRDEEMEDEKEEDLTAKNYEERVISMTNVQRCIWEYEFVSGLQPMYQCRTVDLCSVQALSLSAFTDILQQLSLLQHFHMLRQQTLIQGKLHRVLKKCIVCLAQHLQTQCPQLFPHVSITNHLKANMCTHDHSRKRIFSRQTRKSNKIINITSLNKIQYKQIFSGFFLQKIGQHFLEVVKIIDFETITVYKNYYPQCNVC